MSPTSRHLSRRHRWAGAIVALGVAVTTAVAANGATRDAGTPPSVGAGAPPASSLVSDCASIGPVLSAGAGALGSGASADAVHAARGRAVGVARSTTSDDVRERVQNLADDLAAYRVAVASKASNASSASADEAHRRADIAAMVRDDLSALRRLCAH